MDLSKNRQKITVTTYVAEHKKQFAFGGVVGLLLFIAIFIVLQIVSPAKLLYLLLLG